MISEVSFMVYKRHECVHRTEPRRLRQLPFTKFCYTLHVEKNKLTCEFSRFSLLPDWLLGVPPSGNKGRQPMRGTSLDSTPGRLQPPIRRLRWSMVPAATDRKKTQSNIQWSTFYLDHKHLNTNLLLNVTSKELFLKSIDFPNYLHLMTIIAYILKPVCWKKSVWVSH